MSQSNDDAVRSPGHYAGHTGIECRDAIASMIGRESAADHWVATAVEYLWRWRGKDGVRCGEWFRHYVCAGCQPHVAPFRRQCGGEYPADVAEAFAAYRADLP